MFNSVILVGRVVEKPVCKQLDSGVTVATLTLAVVRPFKNSDGEYETDFIKCSLWEGIADIGAQYCTKGSVIGVKGRLAVRSTDVTFEDAKKNIKVLEVVAERLSFIQTAREVDGIKE